MRFEERRGNVLNVLRIGTTSNDKIAPVGTVVMQTYHFSRKQFEFIAEGGRGGKNLMDPGKTAANCMSCPLRKGGCYTHKHPQSTGFLSMLRSVANKYTDWDNIPESFDIVDVCESMRDNGVTYTRFGSYGEPVMLLPRHADMIAQQSGDWTGYTHTWRSKAMQHWKLLLMASVDDSDVGEAKALGWDEYQASSNGGAERYSNCPASKEQGYKTSCAECLRCGSKKGGGIWISKH